MIKELTNNNYIKTVLMSSFCLVLMGSLHWIWYFRFGFSFSVYSISFILLLFILGFSHLLYYQLDKRLFTIAQAVIVSIVLAVSQISLLLIGRSILYFVENTHKEILLHHLVKELLNSIYYYVPIMMTFTFISFLLVVMLPLIIKRKNNNLVLEQSKILIESVWNKKYVLTFVSSIFIVYFLELLVLLLFNMFYLGFKLFVLVCFVFYTVLTKSYMTIFQLVFCFCLIGSFMIFNLVYSDMIGQPDYLAGKAMAFILVYNFFYFSLVSTLILLGFLLLKNKLITKKT